MQGKYEYMDQLFLDSIKNLDALSLVKETPLQELSVRDGVYLPAKKLEDRWCAGVLTADGEYVELSAFLARSPVDAWGGAYELSNSVEHVHKRVLYFGRFWKHWGHFIMDEVSRLWGALKHTDYLIAYDGPDNISGVYLEFFRLLGIGEERLIRVDKPTRFDEIFIPECAHKPGLSCHVEYKQMFDQIAERALKEFKDHEKYQDKQVYLTRTGIKARVPMELGEKDIEQVYRDNGAVIVSPEKCSLVEQIAMYRLAKEIICVSGTLPHNMIFAKDHGKLTVYRKSNKPVYRQWDVDQLRELTVTNIDAHISLNPVGPVGPFLLDVNQNVRRFWKEQGMKFHYNPVSAWFKRKGKVLWYLPVYIARTRGKKYTVPLFDGENFVTRESAAKELRRFYMRRI